MPILGAQPGVASRIASGLAAIPSSREEEKKLFISLPQKRGLVPPLRQLEAPSLLERRSRFHSPLWNTKQIYLDQISTKLQQQLTYPGNIILGLGALRFLKSAPVLMAFEGIAQWSARVYLTYPPIKIAVAASLSALACEPTDGNAPNQYQAGDVGSDMTPDEGLIPYDADGDGVPVGLDCDDNNIHKFPLIAELGVKNEEQGSTTIQISADTEVCPGVYNGFSLEVMSGTKNIELKGEDVILDGRVNDVSVYDQAIRVVNGDNITIRGFNIQSYHEPVSGPGIVRVLSSKDVNLIHLSVTADGGYRPIWLVDSESTLIDGIITYTRSDRGLHAERCNNTEIRDSQFVSTPPYDYDSQDYGLLHFEGGMNNTVTGTRLLEGRGYGLYVRAGLQFQALGLVINGNGKSGIFLDGVKQSNFSQNAVNRNDEYGLFSQGNTVENVFIENNWSENSLGAYGQRVGAGDAPLEENTFTNNVPQP